MRSGEREGESGSQQAAGDKRTVRKPHRRCHQQASAHRPALRAVRGESCDRRVRGRVRAIGRCAIGESERGGASEQAGGGFELS